MMTRRALVGVLACGGRAGDQPAVAIIAGPAATPVPARFAAEACVFSRAYAACPDAVSFRKTLGSGCFPHKRDTPALLTVNFAAQFPPAPETAVFVSHPGGESAFERSTHIALAIRHSRLAGGRVFDFPVSTVDIAPTLLGLSGAPVPKEIHGRDLSALLMTGTGERPEAVYAEGGLNGPGEWRMLVRGLDKIVVRPNLDVLHLFNLGEDPDEEHDLAAEIGYRLKVDELTAQVHAWMKRTGDGMDPSGLRRR
jgi:hypothetical protein